MAITPAERFSIEPAPTWAYNPDLQELLAKNQETGSTNLFFQQETDLEDRGIHARNIYRLGNAEEVKMGSNIEFDLEPNCFRLAVHHINVIRDNQVIACADPEEFRFIQPEESRHSLVFDGRYLAIFLLDDVRPGDVLDISHTTYHLTPSFPGRYFGALCACALAGADFFRTSIRPRPSQKLNFKLLGGSVAFQEETDSDGRVRHVYTAADQKSLRFSGHAPSWFRQVPIMSWTDFASWQEVSATVFDLWAEKINAASNDEELENCITNLQVTDLAADEKIDKLIRFVQNDIRYLSLSEGIQSFIPRSPGKALSKRYGDCKDKSILLSMLLWKIGVESWPALVHSSFRETISESLPSPNAFDHVIVCFQYREKEYWVDPTMTGQGGTVMTRTTPRFGKALPIRAGGSELVEIPTDNTGRSVITLEEDIYLEKDRLRIQIETIAIGTEADGMRSMLNLTGKDRVEENLRDFTARIYANATISSPMLWEDNSELNRLRTVEYYEADAVTEISPLAEMGKHYPVTPVILATRIVGLDKGDLPKSPIALPYPMNLKHHLRFHHKLRGVSWNRTREKVEGPGFVYNLDCFTKAKLATFLFSYETTRPHIMEGEASEYRDKMNEVFSSLGRGVPVKKGDPWLLVGIVAILLMILYYFFRTR